MSEIHIYRVRAEHGQEKEQWGERTSTEWFETRVAHLQDRSQAFVLGSNTLMYEEFWLFRSNGYFASSINYDWVVGRKCSPKSQMDFGMK